MVTKKVTLIFSITLFYMTSLIPADPEEFYVERSQYSTNFSLKTVHFLPDNKFIYKTKETIKGEEEDVEVTNVIVCDRTTRLESKVESPELAVDQKISRIIISPNGQIIAYVIKPSDCKKIVLCFYNVITKEEKKLTINNFSYNSIFTFSPDSSKFGIAAPYSKKHKCKLLVIDIAFAFRGHIDPECYKLKFLTYLKILIYNERINSLVFTHDNQNIVCITNAFSRLANLSSKEVKTIEDIGNLKKHTFSPDGKTLVGASKNVGTKGIRVFDYVANDQYGFMYHKNHTVQLIKKLNIHDCCSANIHSLMFSPDSNKLVSTGEYSYHNLDIWDMQNHTNIFTTTLEAKFNYAEFSHDGREVISASDDGFIRIWNFDNNNIHLGATHE